eukprot:6121569-Pleurochrysis_carterae.AAC.1
MNVVGSMFAAFLHDLESDLSTPLKPPLRPKSCLLLCNSIPVLHNCRFVIEQEFVLYPGSPRLFLGAFIH